MSSGSFNYFILIALIICATPTTSLANIGVICTLDTEYDLVRRLLDEPLTTNHAGREFTKGVINKQSVVVVVSPMGKVNNAITATLLVERYNVKRILSVGTAGSLTSKLPIGSVMYATTSVFHDQGRALATGVEPYRRRYPEVELRKKRLREREYHVGLIASGDQFIANADLAQQIRKITGAHAVDTNSAAIGSVCKTYGINCLFVRQITDGANTDSAFEYQLAIGRKLEHLSLVEYFIKGEFDAI